MRSITYFTFLLLALGIVFQGCKSTKETTSDRTVPIPSSFSGNVTDTLNSASISWKQYFNDPDLIALIEIGLKNNLDMLKAMQRIEAARSGVILQKGAMLPTLSANAAYWQRKFGYYTMDDAGNRTTAIEPGKMVPTHLPDYYIGLQTAWEIDIWGKLRNKRKAAFARFFATVEGKNIVVTNLISDIANNYYELLALDNELNVIRETIKLQQKAFEAANLQKETGHVNELTVKQFGAQLSRSKAFEYDVLQRIIECENQINFLLGRYPQVIQRNSAQINKDLPFKPLVGIPNQLLRNRPDIRQSEMELVASKADVKAAKAAFYPSLNISGTLGLQGYKAGYLFTDPQSMAYNLLGGLVAPLINRAAIKAEFKSANAQQQVALYNYQRSIINGYVEVYNEMSRINNLDSVAFYKKKEVDDLESSVDISGDLFNTGKSNYVEVLMTQRNSLEAKLELIDIKKRQYNTLVNIYRALGGGWR